uniref:Uncharacterized protein n=1 Tax=Oryza nivara TaxID=4536 RepID=A0A0E0FZW9_ORYNI
MNPTPLTQRYKMLSRGRSNKSPKPSDNSHSLSKFATSASCECLTAPVAAALRVFGLVLAGQSVGRQGELRRAGRWVGCSTGAPAGYHACTGQFSWEGQGHAHGRGFGEPEEVAAISEPMRSGKLVEERACGRRHAPFLAWSRISAANLPHGRCLTPPKCFPLATAAAAAASLGVTGSDMSAKPKQQEDPSYDDESGESRGSGFTSANTPSGSHPHENASRIAPNTTMSSASSSRSRRRKQQAAAT